MTISSEGRPQTGRPLLQWGNRHTSPHPAGGLAHLAAPRCDARVDWEPGRPKSRGSRRLRPMEGESRLPGRPVRGPSVSRDRPGRRHGCCPRARAGGVPAAPVPAVWRVAGGGEPGVSPSPAFLLSHPSGLRCPFSFGNWSGSCACWVPQTRRKPEPVPRGGPDSPGVLQVSDLCQMRGGHVSFPHPDGGIWSLHGDGGVTW